jgi:hypothetical protein
MGGRGMTDSSDRRTDPARRRRVELLIGRVRNARDEIVARGLDAVHGPRSPERDTEAGDAPPERPPDGA